MAEQQKGIFERALDKRAEWASNQPSLGAEVNAIIREGIKDVREQVVMQGFFGHRDGHGEPGTPLNPTVYEVTKDRETGKFEALLDQAASRGSVHGQEKDKGMER